MLGKVNLCETNLMPRIRREFILGNDKVFNYRGLKIWKSDVLGSENIRMDVSGAMYTDEGHFSGFNAQPSIKSNGYKYILDNLEKMWHEIENAGNSAWVFLCGGLNQDLDKSIAPHSYELYNRIADFFDENQIPFGMICGKKNLDTKDNIRMYRGKLYMWGENLHDCFKKDRSDQEILDAVPGYYSDVFMPDNIEFVTCRKKK